MKQWKIIDNMIDDIDDGQFVLGNTPIEKHIIVFFRRKLNSDIT